MGEKETRSLTILLPEGEGESLENTKSDPPGPLFVTIENDGD